MRICHVTSVHSRHDIRICEKECVSLVKAGYEVFLVVNDEDADERYKGINIVSTGVTDKSRMNRIIRAPKRVLYKALSVSAEVYHLHDPELLLIANALLQAGKKVIYDAHEDTEKQIMTKYWIPQIFRRIVSKCYVLYASKIYKKMDGLISVTPSVVEKLKQYNKNVAMITNYPIIEVDEAEAEAIDSRDEQDGYVFFAGGIAEQWCHEIVSKAVEKVEGISYLFAGRGRQEYIDRMADRGTKLHYLGLLPHDDVKRYYKRSIAGMAILRSNTQAGHEGTLGNTKLFEVMEAGRPVICSDLKLWREIIEKYSCGICVEYDDVDAIADAIRYLSEHPEESDLMGANGRKAIEECYNWSTQEELLYAFYKDVIVSA